MPRKTKVTQIKEAGRDNGKIFLLTEKPAMQVEKWATRAGLAIIASGVEVPPGFLSMGIAGIVVVGFKVLGGVRWQDLEPLMDEMFECVSLVPDPANPNFSRALIEGDIEEVKTMATLRMEVFELHTGFSIADILSKAVSAKAVK